MPGRGEVPRREAQEVEAVTASAERESPASTEYLMGGHARCRSRTVLDCACKMGLEGIVSKRKDSFYRSGRCPDWLKSKNPTCAAVKREAEEDWGKEKWR